MRFHLRELLTVVAVSGLVCAAFVQGGRMWETIVFSGTLLVVLVAALLAIGRPDGARRFWLGFAVAAGAYLAFAHLADERGCVPRRDAPEFTSRVLFWGIVIMTPDGWSIEAIRNGEGGGLGGMGGGMFEIDDFAELPKTQSSEDDPSNDPGKPFKINGRTVEAADVDYADFDVDEVTSDIQRRLNISTQAGNVSITVGGGLTVVVPKDLNAQFRIGHCAWALLFGWLAGHLLSALAIRGKSTV